MTLTMLFRHFRAFLSKKISLHLVPVWNSKVEMYTSMENINSLVVKI